MNKDFIKVAICDDEECILNIFEGMIRTMLSENNYEVELKKFLSGESLLESCKTYNYDLLFLDIEIGNENGIEVARKINCLKNGSKIVFVSSHNELVFDSLEVHPYGFVRKDNAINDLRKIIFSLKEKIEKRNNNVLVIEGKETYSLLISNIIYIESDGKHQIIHLNNNEKISVRKNFGYFIDELKKYNFIQIHKCYLVNAEYIKSINQDTVKISNDESLIISKRKNQEIKKEYLNFLRSKNRIVVTNKE